MGTGHRSARESIETLIHRARAPDVSVAVRHAAFGLIVERYQDAAYGCALAALGDPHLAWDAAQEAFLTAYCALEQLRSPEAFPAWLRRIVRTRCRQLRREHQPAMASLDAVDQLWAVPDLGAGRIDADVDPVVAAEARERRAALAAAVGALPDSQRLVTVLFYVSGYPQHEIAEFLNVPLTTVKKRLQAARKQLHARLVKLMDDGGLEHYGREYLPSQTEGFMRTVRMLTSFDGGQSVLELLFIDGLDVNTRDIDGRTLLSWAAQRGQLEATVFLLRHGAQINARDRSGTTPRGWAERADRRELATLLARAGGTW
jgi:RNA polymerase sigma factor (sigma-70 family)